MKYKVSGHGAKKVEFACPNCTSPLESPLEDAGQHFACPTCQHDLTVPGVRELNHQIAEAKAMEAARLRAEHDRAAAVARKAEEAKANEARKAEEAREREVRRLAKANAPRAHVSMSLFVTTVTTLALTFALLFVLVIRPLQIRLTMAEGKLRDTTELAERTAGGLTSLAGTVNTNTDALASLTKTVNNNADAANRTTRSLSSALDSLTETVNYNARISNMNRFR